jgi:hypothetical protein
MLRFVRIALTGAAAVGCILTSGSTTFAAAAQSPTRLQIRSGTTVTGIPRPLSQILTPSDTFQIHNFNALGRCIGISGYLAGDWNCTTNPDQTWHWGSPNGWGYNQLVNGYGQCLALAGGSHDLGTAIWGFNCLGLDHPDQYWALVSNGDGTFQINNYKAVSATFTDATLIGVSGGSTDNGAPLVLYRPDGTRNQSWFFVF